MDFSPGKELLHTKMDLEAMQEVVRLMQSENARLRQLIHDLQSDHAHQVQTMVDNKIVLETSVAELKVELEHSRTERTRLESELTEAVQERKRQVHVVHEVRKQVDGRLSKLMEELHRRDEEVHKLQYLNREQERKLERLSLIETAAGPKDEALQRLQAQLQSLQGELNQTAQENASLKTELRFVSKEKSDMQHHEASQSLALSQEAQQVLPLYRQWCTSVERSLLELEDNLDGLCDEIIDAEHFYLHETDNTAAIPDRRRLSALKKIDRDRLMAQQHMLAHVAAHGDNDATVLTVQAIRSSCDASRYTLGKCAASMGQLKDLVGSLRTKITKRMGRAAVDPRTPRTASSIPPPQDRPDATEAALDLSRRDLDTARHSLAQLQDAFQKKEARNNELERAVAEISSQNVTLTAQVKQLEFELNRRTLDCESTRKLLSVAESDAHKLREELQQVRSELRNERERYFETTKDLEIRSQAAQKNVEETLQRRAHESQQESSGKLRVLEAELSLLKDELKDAANREDRMKAVLEESRQKRLTLKRQREELLDELQEVRGMLAQQAKELKLAQEMQQSLTMELDRTRLALELEVRHDEAARVDANLFREWKSAHQQPSMMAGAAARSQQQTPPPPPQRVVLLPAARTSSASGRRR